LEGNKGLGANEGRKGNVNARNKTPNIQTHSLTRTHARTDSFGDEKLPFIVLLGNKIDLNHMRAVKEVKARNYAVENEFLDMNVSAKSGDKVDVVFTQIAAALCGVIMQKAELDSETAIVTAAITNHQQHDEKVQHIDYTKQRSKCSIM